MHQQLIDLLFCPDCHRDLEWAIHQQDDIHIEEAEARCAGCEATFPVREGIGLFLTPDLPRKDLWQLVDSQLVQQLRENPEQERQLMAGPLADLNGTDQSFRALVLEERGDFAGARETEAAANNNMYTAAYNQCWQSQVEYLSQQVSTLAGPIVDLASGRGYLVEQLVQRQQRLVVASDFSPAVLRRDRKLFQFLGLYDRVSLLAFDARRTPFKDGALPILTTNLGLPNIEQPGKLVAELRRIVGGSLLAVSFFFPEEDEVNGKVIKEAGLDDLLFQPAAVAQFTEAGWTTAVKNICVSEARPTPLSDIFAGARADGLPVADTRLTWGVLQAT